MELSTLITGLILLIFMINFLKQRFFSTMASPQIKQKVQTLIKDHPIFVASKSYCPYCNATKGTLNSITKNAYIIELDQMADGSEIQDALYELTGQRTVPNVFIGGKHIGGNSDVQALHSKDQLEEQIKAVL